MILEWLWTGLISTVKTLIRLRLRAIIFLNKQNSQFLTCILFPADPKYYISGYTFSLMQSSTNTAAMYFFI